MLCGRAGELANTVLPCGSVPACDFFAISLLPVQEFHYLVLKVWHRSGSGRDRVLGLVLIDLVPLLHGLNELLGWYNIVDLAGVCRGQMKVSEL